MAEVQGLEQHTKCETLGRVFLAAIALGSLLSAYMAADWALADYLGDQVYESMLTWTDTTMPSSRVLHRTIVKMEKALELDSNNPTFQHRLGRLYHLLQRTTPGKATTSGVRAVEYFRASLSKRPHWPSAWSGLALVKMELGSFDGEFSDAVVSASRFGPWEPGVDQQISAIGISSWSKLNAEARVAVVGNVARGLLSPVQGTPGTIIHSVRSNVDGLTVDLVAELATILLTQDWSVRSSFERTDLVLMLWPVWPEQVRMQLVKKIRGAVMQPGWAKVMDLIEREKKLPLICAVLPLEHKFRPRCIDSRVR